MKMWTKVAAVLALAVITASIGFIGGYGVARSAITAVPGMDSQSSVVSERVQEVERVLQEQALKPPSETSATAGAIQGLLESGGDQYGLYFNARHYKYFNEESMGEFGGIGVVLGEKDGTAYVVEVYKDTPAFRAGMKAGDIFLEINGVRRDKWATEEVVKRVRGEKGTVVKLTMLRPDKAAPASHPGGQLGEELRFSMTRAMIQVPNIKSELKGDVGYIRMSQFTAKSTEEISGAVKSLEGKGAKALVLDLRENPGGLLSQAVDVASLFIKSGTIVRIEERGKTPAEERATGSMITELPLVVLIDGNSASASEIVAGALQDYKRATLVGEKSFGKGSVQTIKPLSFGGAIKFTIAHYLTPKSRVIDGKGLTPDVVVKMEADKQADEKTDIQLKKALEIARQSVK
jgi:carboxyl-terminal processing protease